MKTMQAVLLDKMEVALVRPGSGTAVRQQAVWSNMGTLYLQLGLHTLLEVRYDFQGRTLKVGVLGVGPKDMPEWFVLNDDANFNGPIVGVTWWALDYTDGDRLVRMLRILTYLAAARLEQHVATPAGS